MMERPLVVATKLVAPFVNKTANGKLGGFLFDIWEDIETELG